MTNTTKSVAIAAVSFTTGSFVAAVFMGIPRDGLLLGLAIGLPVLIVVATLIVLIKNYPNPTH